MEKDCRESFFFAVMHRPQNRSSTSHGRVESLSIGSRIGRWMECKAANGEEEASRRGRQKKKKLENTIVWDGGHIGRRSEKPAMRAVVSHCNGEAAIRSK